MPADGEVSGPKGPPWELRDGEGTLRRKISNAAPIKPLPVSVGSPASQSERKAEPKPLIEATSPAAIMACHRFWRAASDCERAIDMAYSPKVDETHWASVNQQWLVWQHDAQCRAQACKTERLPEPLLTEVLNKLHSLDHLWKIACDYRADHKGPGDGPRPEVSKRVDSR